MNGSIFLLEADTTGGDSIPLIDVEAEVGGREGAELEAGIEVGVGLAITEVEEIVTARAVA